MAVMFRTNDITRGDLKQQRVKDTGFGIVQRSEKSFGRPGTPMTIHNIIETMLPPRQGKKRVFVELFPGFFSRRPGWISIDESSNLSSVEITSDDSSDFSLDIDDRLQEDEAIPADEVIDVEIDE